MGAKPFSAAASARILSSSGWWNVDTRPHSVQIRMIVLGRPDLRFVTLESLVEVMLGGEPEFDEQRQRTIDGSLSGVFAPLAEGRRDVIGREVSGGFEQDLRDGLALMCEWELTLPEFAPKDLHHYRRAAERWSGRNRSRGIGHGRLARGV